MISQSTDGQSGLTFSLRLPGSFQAEYFGMRAFGAIQGLVFSVATLGGVLGPVFAGWIYDQTESYRLAFVLLSAGSLAAAPLVLTVSRPSWAARPSGG